jgi:hypothetical protein
MAMKLWQVTKVGSDYDVVICKTKNIALREARKILEKMSLEDIYGKYVFEEWPYSDRITSVFVHYDSGKILSGWCIVKEIDVVIK